MGFYLAPDDASSVERVIRYMEQRPHGAELMVVGDLEGNRQDEEITAAPFDAVLEYMSDHFLPHQTPWARYGHTWIMLMQGRVVRSETDYILGTYFRLFHNVSFRDPRHSTYHYMVLGCIHGASCRENQCCLRWCTRLPLLPPHGTNTVGRHVCRTKAIHPQATSYIETVCTMYLRVNTE